LRQLTQTSRFACSKETFWTVFKDEAYLRALYVEGLGFKGFEILELAADTRKLRIVPKLNVPSTLAKLIGDAFAYEEHGRFDRAKGEWTWRMVQPATSRMAEIVSTRGAVHVDEIAAGECERVDELTVEGKVFGLRALIESSAEKEARSAWAKEAVFMAEWLRRHATPA